MNLRDAKSDLRRQIGKRLKLMTPKQRALASAQARSLIEQQPAWKNARTFFFYASCPEELDVWPLLLDSLAAGKAVALPRFERQTRQYVACQIQNLQTDIVQGHFNIREPSPDCPEVPLNRLDLVLVPGVAFDLHGRRLGRGKGYYDRLLAGFGGIKCGVAFDEQIVAEVPAGPQDIQLNCILTPTRWIET